jgi:NAD(P)-dependent dehydrogenase (short-subunit alcohol dehydrogenase family)
MKMQDVIAIVTGGASGLGAGTAKRFVDYGARVMILDCDEEKGRSLSAKLGESARFSGADVSKEDDIQRTLEYTAAEFGRLNVLINCAGVGIAIRTTSSRGPHPLEQFETVIRINLIGAFNVIRLASTLMAENGPFDSGERGVIVNTASVAAYEGQIGQAAYSASKGGLIGMTLPIARDLARYGIRVCTIAPGIFDTPLLGNLPEDRRASLGAQMPFPQRLGLPAEFAQLAQQIVENEMLNGETIRLDGALRMGSS